MTLDDVCAVFQSLQFPGLEERAHPERAAVLAARACVTTAFASDEFFADCISRELQLIEENRLRSGLVPFFTLPKLGIHFALGYWSPGVSPGPHEHTAWTITAVCHNALEVLTYDREASYRTRRLVPKNRFQALAGSVGFIHDPCIHEPRNISSESSISLHVVSPRDGERTADHQEPLPALDIPSRLRPVDVTHPFTGVLIARQRARYVHQLAVALGKTSSARSPELLGRCRELASSATRRWIRRISKVASVEEAEEPRWILARTHESLALRHRDKGDMVALDVDTANGPRQAFATSGAAREAVAFASRELRFDVAALPGDLSVEERAALADALEESGLFTRARQ